MVQPHKNEDEAGSEEGEGIWDTVGTGGHESMKLRVGGGMRDGIEECEDGECRRKGVWMVKS